MGPGRTAPAAILHPQVKVVWGLSLHQAKPRPAFAMLDAWFGDICGLTAFPPPTGSPAALTCRPLAPLSLMQAGQELSAR